MSETENEATKSGVKFLAWLLLLVGGAFILRTSLGMKAPSLLSEIYQHWLASAPFLLFSVPAILVLLSSFLFTLENHETRGRLISFWLSALTKQTNTLRFLAFSLVVLATVLLIINSAFLEGLSN